MSTTKVFRAPSLILAVLICCAYALFVLPATPGAAETSAPSPTRVDSYKVTLTATALTTAQTSLISIVDQGATKAGAFKVTLTAKVSSTAGDITKVMLRFKSLRYGLQASFAPNIFTPAKEVTVSAEGDAGAFFQTYEYTWEATDSAGNIFTSPVATGRSGPVEAFAWKQFASPNGVTVAYYEGDETFAASIADTAHTIETNMINTFGFTPAPLWISVVRDVKDFCIAIQPGGVACDPKLEFFGGAESRSRSVLVILKPEDTLRNQLRFERAVGDSFIGAWFEKAKRTTSRQSRISDSGFFNGLILSYSATMQSIAPARLTALVAADAVPGLINNTAYDKAYGANDVEGVMAFDVQDYSAFTYLVKQYGMDKIAAMTKRYVEQRPDFATLFAETTGKTIDEFETEWRTSIGLTTTVQIVPSDTPLPPLLPTSRPAPTMRSFKRTATSTPQ